jgi:hypothetical protein
MTTQVVLSEVRGSYVNIFTPKQDDQGKDKWSMTVLIPKNDTQQLQRLRVAQKTAIVAKYGDKPPPGLKSTIYDGDGVRPSDGQPFGAECKGHYVMSVSSTKRPGIVDGNVQPILDASKVVSGDYFNVEVNAFCYENKGNKGVSFGLNNVQWVRKGEPLSGQRRPEDVFKPVATTDAGATATADEAFDFLT